MEVLETYKTKNSLTGKTELVEITEEDLTSFGRHKVCDERCEHCFMGCHEKLPDLKNKMISQPTASKIELSKRNYRLAPEVKAWLEKETRKAQKHIDELKTKQFLETDGRKLIKKAVDEVFKDDQAFKKIVEEAVRGELKRIREKINGTADLGDNVSRWKEKIKFEI
jgi:ribosomal protein S17E